MSEHALDYFTSARLLKGDTFTLHKLSTVIFTAVIRCNCFVGSTQFCAPFPSHSRLFSVAVWGKAFRRHVQRNCLREIAHHRSSTAKHHSTRDGGRKLVVVSNKQIVLN